MKMRGRFAALLAGGLAAALLAGGCEDQAAKRRAEVQTIIAEAGRELAQVPTPLSPDDQRFDEAKRTLNGVLSKLGQAAEGEAGQQAAAALLAAGAQRKLASLSLARIQEIEAEHQRLRFLLHSEIDAALHLDALASGRERISTSDERMMLDDKREELRARLHEYSERLAELDGPIAEREAANEEDMQRAASLEEQANTLRREASHRGHAEGLEQFQQAIELEREADQYEYRVAQRENDLRHDLQPERTLAESRIAAIQGMLVDIRETESALVQRDSITSEQASDIREAIASVGDRIREALTQVGAVAAGDLEQAYGEALNHLEKAATQASRAASRSPRGEGDAARLMVAQIHNQQGRLHWTRARGIADHMTVLRRLVDAGQSLGGVAQARSDLQALKARHDEAIEQATAAFNNARQNLEQIRGGGAELSELKQHVDNSLALLAGEAVQPIERRRPTGSAPTGASTASGFESPEAAVSYMNSIADGSLDNVARLLDAIHCQSESSRKIVRLQRTGLEVLEDLKNAMDEQFGGQVGNAFGTGMETGFLQQTAFQNPEIVDRTETRVTVRHTNPVTGEETFDLILVDGSWVLDGETLFGQLGPAEQQALDAAPAMYEAMRGVAQRVRAGEFSSVQEASQALLAVIMNAANQGGGLQPPG